jgi:hypothetical protein
MSDNVSVKWVTKIYKKYFMAHERAWKAGKFVQPNYSLLRFKIRKILSPGFNLNFESKCSTDEITQKKNG